MKKILLSTTAMATLLKSLMLNKKTSILVNLFAFIIISASSTSAFAVTIKNENTNTITYRIYTDGGTRECATGLIMTGESLKNWEKSEECPETPAHLEIAVSGKTAIPSACFPTDSWIPRILNKGSTATVTSSFWGVRCSVTTE